MALAQAGLASVIRRRCGIRSGMRINQSMDGSALKLGIVKQNGHHMLAALVNGTAAFAVAQGMQLKPDTVGFCSIHGSLDHTGRIRLFACVDTALLVILKSPFNGQIAEITGSLLNERLPLQII